MSAPPDRNLARTPEAWDRRGRCFQKKKSKSRLALAARKWAVGAVFISPSSLIKAPLCSSPSQPLYQFNHNQHVSKVQRTRSHLYRCFSTIGFHCSHVLSSMYLEQTSGSNEPFRLLSLSGGAARSFLFTILTLFFFINFANLNISRFKISNESSANAVTLRRLRESQTLQPRRLKTALCFLEPCFCKPRRIWNILPSL